MGFKIALIICILVGLITAGCGIPTTPPPLAQPTKPSAASQFVVAGSGSNLFVTEKLAQAYQKKTGVAITIPGSIGSVGAINAIKAGSLELGLISQHITPQDRAAGLTELPYARVAILFAAADGVPDRNITTTQLLAILNGVKTTWSDGTKIFVQVREAQDSSNQVLNDLIPGYKAALTDSYQQKRWQIHYRDNDMTAALVSTKGAFGLVTASDIAVFKDKIVPVALDGIQPTAENVANGSYKAVKELAFVYKGDLSPQSAHFIDFVFSLDGQKLLQEWGAIPLRR